MPTLRFATAVVSGIVPRFTHAPSRTQRSAATTCRSEASISATARSATSSVSTSGVLVTAMPLARAWPRSIASTPTPKHDTSFSFGSAFITAASQPRPPEVTSTSQVPASDASSAALSAASW